MTRDEFATKVGLVLKKRCMGAISSKEERMALIEACVTRFMTIKESLTERDDMLYAMMAVADKDFRDSVYSMAGI